MLNRCLPVQQWGFFFSKRGPPCGRVPSLFCFRLRRRRSVTIRKILQIKKKTGLLNFTYLGKKTGEIWKIQKKREKDMEMAGKKLSGWEWQTYPGIKSVPTCGRSLTSTRYQNSDLRSDKFMVWGMEPSERGLINRLVWRHRGLLDMVRLALNDYGQSMRVPFDSTMFLYVRIYWQCLLGIR